MCIIGHTGDGLASAVESLVLSLHQLPLRELQMHGNNLPPVARLGLGGLLLASPSLALHMFSCDGFTIRRMRLGDEQRIQAQQGRGAGLTATEQQLSVQGFDLEAVERTVDRDVSGESIGGYNEVGTTANASQSLEW